MARPSSSATAKPLDSLKLDVGILCPSSLKACLTTIKDNQRYWQLPLKCFRASGFPTDEKKSMSSQLHEVLPPCHTVDGRSSVHSADFSHFRIFNNVVLLFIPDMGSGKIVNRRTVALRFIGRKSQHDKWYMSPFSNMSYGSMSPTW